MFEVERNVPQPTHRRKKYPFLDMGVGDSFVVPEELSSRVRAAASAVDGMKFTIRKQENGTLRCWRIA